MSKKVFVGEQLTRIIFSAEELNMLIDMYETNRDIHGDGSAESESVRKALVIIGQQIRENHNSNN